MRTLPEGTIVTTPRSRLRRLWWALGHQFTFWGRLWLLAWTGIPGEPMTMITEPLKKGRKGKKQMDRMSKAYEKAAKH